MRFRPSLLVLPGYLIFALLLTWPLAREFARSVPAVYGATDALLQSFILGWDFRALATRPFEIFNAPNFHPFPRTLTYMDHLIGEAVVSWPVHAFSGNLALAYNFLVVLSFVASGWATYRVARLFGVSRGGSFLGGFLFAFSHYRYCNLGGLNQLQTQFLPLGLFFAIRFFRNLRLRDFAGALLALAVQSWFGWYYTFYLGLALVVLVAYKLVQGTTPWKGLPRRGLAVVSVVAVLLILPGVLPYWQEQRATPGFRRTLGMTLLYSADLLDYFKVNVHNWLARAVPALGGDNSYWPGLVTLVLAAVGVARIGRTRPPSDSVATSAGSNWLALRMARRVGAAARSWARRWEDWGFLLVLAAVAFLMSLGPVLHVAGKRIKLPLPYLAAFFLIPGFNSLRVPCRFAVLVVLVAAVMAGFGFDALRKNLRRAGLRAALLPAVLALAVLESWSAPFPMISIPTRETMPPVYHWLADQPGDFPVLELPTPRREIDESPLYGTRQLYALLHGKARLDGVSGFVPPRYNVFRMVMQNFPAPGAIREAREFGARYIIFHYGDLKPDERAGRRLAAAASPELREAAAFGDDVVYEIVR